MKYKVTLTLNLDLPNEKTEDDAKIYFATTICALIKFDKMLVRDIKDFSFVDCKAEKIKGNIHG
jgi:hypothetical protein